MAIIRITKQQVKKAQRARAAALKKDPDFRAFERELEKQNRDALTTRREALKRQREE
jgi:hypothetical protein